MRNESGVDRVVRVVLGVALLVAAWLALGVLSGSIGGIVAAIAGLVLVVTGLVGFCPAYRVAGLSTCGVESDSSGRA